jgi:hypothetical protein
MAGSDFGDVSTRFPTGIALAKRTPSGTKVRHFDREFAWWKRTVA